MAAAPGVAAWVRRHPPKNKLEKAYRETRSVIGVSKAFGVSRSTAHLWVRAAGVKLRSPGTDAIRLAQARKAEMTMAPPPPGKRLSFGASLRRAQCPHGRHWNGQVLACIDTERDLCRCCTRGYEHGLREVSTLSSSSEPGTHEGRRKGVPSSD